MLSFKEGRGGSEITADKRKGAGGVQPHRQALGAKYAANARARASFDQLARHRRVLLLQGPNGPFFARLKDKLEAAGSLVWKVNFNGGDDLFYRTGKIVRFTQPMSMWESLLRGLLADLTIDAIVVFGGFRRQHRIAARLAQSLGIAFWVFEEGYVRPDYITLEAGGVNAESQLASVSLDALPEVYLPVCRRHFTYAFTRMAWFSFWYFVGGMARSAQYPNYRHHKPFRLHEVVLWLRAAYRKEVYKGKEQPIVSRLLSEDHPTFFLVALQVHNDSQIRLYSPWRRIEDFIEWTAFSFAQHAPAGTMLVFKHHPMDRGHTNYADAIQQCAGRFGISKRVAYVHDAHLPSLMQRCDGLVTINSTAGLQAMYHRVPVIALGRCFYAKDGLTYQGSLDDFWRNPKPVDMSTYRRFRSYLVYVTQINSSFYADTRLTDSLEPRSWRWMRCIRLACALGLVAADAFTNETIDVSSILSLVYWASSVLTG